MQFLLVLAVVAAVSIAEYAPPQPVDGVSWRLLLAVLGMAVAPLFAVATSTLIAGSLRRDVDRQGELLRRFGYLRTIHSALWLLLAGAVLHALGWVQLVRFNWGLDGMFLIDDVLILMPIVLPLVLSWAAFYEVERCLHLSELPQDTASAPLVSRRQYLALHVRHYLGLLLAPVLAVLAVHDIIRHVAPYVPGEGEVLLLLLPVAAMIVFFPIVLRSLWETEPLAAGSLRTRLSHFSERAGFEPGEFLVWKTNRMIVNAAVAGIVRPWRYVFFTDALLTLFDDGEIEAVLAHEIGHVQRRHLPERVLAMALPVVLWFVVADMFSSHVDQMSGWLSAIGLNVGWQAAFLGPLALAIYAGTVFAIHARLLEHEADLFAARVCSPTGELLANDLNRIAVMLEKLATVSGAGRSAWSWLHPTIARRVDFLAKVAADPALGERYEFRMRLLGRVLSAVVLLAAVYLVGTN